MPWILASLVSAFFLGCYDLSKKHALRDNAVLPVLFMSTLCGAVVWAILLGVIQVAPTLVPTGLTPEILPLHVHGLIFVKSAIVGASWAFTYFGIKHLPLSLASPIRATGPLWTLAGALLVLGERPSAIATTGILVTLTSFYGLSVPDAARAFIFIATSGLAAWSPARFSVPSAGSTTSTSSAGSASARLRCRLGSRSTCRW